MPKPTKPTLKAAPKTAAPAAPVAEKKTRTRSAVLTLKTPNQLVALIGGDTPVGVSLKSLKTIVVAQNSDKVLADAGL